MCVFRAPFVLSRINEIKALARVPKASKLWVTGSNPVGVATLRTYVPEPKINRRTKPDDHSPETGARTQAAQCTVAVGCDCPGGVCNGCLQSNRAISKHGFGKTPQSSGWTPALGFAGAG